MASSDGEARDRRAEGIRRSRRHDGRQANEPGTRGETATHDQDARRRRAARSSDGARVGAAASASRRGSPRRVHAGRPAPARPRRPRGVPGPQPLFQLSIGHRSIPLVVGRLDRVVQPLQCVVEAGPDRPGRHVETRRDVLDGQIAVEPQRDDDLVVGRQRRDRRTENVTVLGVPGVVAGRERDLDRDVGRLPALGTQSVPTGVDKDPVEPWLEPRRIAQGLPLPPGLHEGIVGGVLRLGRVAQDRARQPVGPIEVLVREADERGIARGSRHGRSPLLVLPLR